ncbi:Polynucleotide 5'-hydroxyl-kinase grc3 [Mortierella sp. NVP85]|nr:Polynucleotide 5'-hydroxyl-kinase grc3 [Mortierella sp. NVP85]
MSGTVRIRREKAQEITSAAGLDLTAISTFTIFSPRTHALAVIESMILTKSQGETMTQQKTSPTPTALRQDIEALLTQFTLSDFDTVLAVQSASDCGIVGIEKVVPLFKGIFSMKQTSHFRAIEDGEKLAQIRFKTGLTGFHPILDTTEGVVALKVSSTWKDAMKALIDSTMDENGERVKRPPVSVVCGGKKMGKSTFSRLILNRMLNRYRRVAFIECDIGQTEFTPVGMVALHVLETPALGAPFTHPRRPYRAFFVGNSTPRDDPEYYLACVKELVRTYYAEVSHTRCWEDTTDDNHRVDDEDDQVPLIVNTQGWIKGLGYELLLQILDYTVPSHIFGLHSPSTSDSNLPPTFLSALKERPMMAGRQHPTLIFVNAAAVEDGNNTSPFTKYHPADHRALALLSYFYQKHLEETSQDVTGDILEWDFTLALVQRRPWCWDWSQAKGVWILFDQVPRSQILHALNASLVALTGDRDPRYETRQDRPISDYQSHTTSGQNLPGSLCPPNYFPLGQYPPPPPELTTCHGLAIIRSIQPTTRTLHILTPVPLATLDKCNGIVKGSIHMPLHANLDHNEENPKVPGVTGVPWKNVPYLHYEAPVGHYCSQSPSTSSQSPRLSQTARIPGSDAKMTRKNLSRKRLLQ